MAAISQRIANFLGGVSQQVDERLFPGQVRGALNAYPDPTQGLTKRPGGRFIKELRAANNSLIAPGTFDNADWFTIFRDNNEKYIGNVLNGTLSIWSLIDGARKTVTLEGSAAAYLTGPRYSFTFTTVNDYTFITNNTVKVEALPDPAYTPRTKATIRLMAVEYSANYVVTINGTKYDVLTRNADDGVGATDPPKKVLDAEELITAIIAKIGSPAGITVTRVGNNIELSSTATMTVTAKGGRDGDALMAFQDHVENIARLPNECVNGRVVEITNSAANASSYYVQFKADNGTSGAGYWEETIKPGLSAGLKASTMPHELVRNADGTFTVRPITWEPRLVGDNDSNSHPSFVGSTIQHPFFFNNRLGFLSEDNVVLSQAGEYFNFYFTTATTLVASDPIDLSCSSVKPAVLHAVVPTTQGLLLFSQAQQFMMSADNNIWTPTTTTIKTISNYECDPLVHPQDLGTTIIFTSKNASYTRVFEILTRGQDENPNVVDQSKIVSEWIPANRDQLVTSPQNSLLSVAGRDSDTLYLWRYAQQGDERQMSAWSTWQLSGKVQHHAVNADVMYAVTRQVDRYVIQDYALTQSPSASGVIASDGSKSNPYLDMWSQVTGTYNSTTNLTKFYLPFPVEAITATRKLCFVCGLTTGPTQLNFTETGLLGYPTVKSDGGGSYVEINGDLSKTAVFIGYTYPFEVILPTIFYRTDDGNDAPASVVVSRYKIYTGLGGDLAFGIKANGRPEWSEAVGSKNADFYKANDTPLDRQHFFTIPIMQRSTNYTFRVLSTLPFPVSLVSMFWEGQYSSRFYTRR